MSRAQAHTLEAFAAGMILLASIVFALQVTAVTPLTASTSSQHIENQQQAVINGVLAGAIERGTLKPTVLYYNTSNGQFWGAREEGYPLGGPPTTFGETLNETFLDHGFAANLNVHVVTESGSRKVQPIVHMGVPSSNAVTGTRTVTLFDDDEIRTADGEPSGSTLVGSDFYADDVGDGTQVYNVIVVEVVVWRL